MFKLYAFRVCAAELVLRLKGYKPVLDLVNHNGLYETFFCEQGELILGGKEITDNKWVTDDGKFLYTKQTGPGDGVTVFNRDGTKYVFWHTLENDRIQHIDGEGKVIEDRARANNVSLLHEPDEACKNLFLKFNIKCKAITAAIKARKMEEVRIDHPSPPKNFVTKWFYKGVNLRQFGKSTVLSSQPT